MAKSTGNSLSIITWNTCGVKPTKRSPNKLIDIMNYGKKQNTDIIFLQETHIGPKCYRKLKQHGWEEMERHWTSYFTVYSPNSKGVAILVNRELKSHYKYICHDEDYAGGYIVLFCQMYGQLFTLVNVYNHKEDKQVLGRLSQYLQEMKIGTLVIGGDFNTVLDLDFDKRTASEHRRHTSLRPLLQSFISSLNLQDTWARLHPTEEAFTRSRSTSHSRLDMFFMPQNKAHHALTCKIHQPNVISDHNPVSLRVQVECTISQVIPRKLSQIGDSETTRRQGKISGAEVLVAIKSLTDSGSDDCTRSTLYDSRSDDSRQSPPCELDDSRLDLTPCDSRLDNLMEIERLKHYYNEVLAEGMKNKKIPKGFNREYKIFATILANRLQMYLEPLLHEKIKIPLSPHCTVTLVLNGKSQINWKFLSIAIKSIKPIPLQNIPKEDTILRKVLSQDLAILRKLLISVEHSCVHKKHLHHDCPLTPALLSLSLKYMEDKISSVIPNVTTRISYQRRSLKIYIDNLGVPSLQDYLAHIREQSGIEMNLLWTEPHSASGTPFRQRNP
ncbi:uncharacterized protein [Salmo salar]|uniref:exodeoxyribonuclease III n=1 Tax=Salmo salar TaxID=8030 RepID=A0ABM3EUY5_SALSA|nr:uncharacterized protein LOC106575617 [Salmo salar]